MIPKNILERKVLIGFLANSVGGANMNFLSVLELIKEGDFQNAKTLLFEILDKGEISNEEIDMLGILI